MVVNFPTVTGVIEAVQAYVAYFPSFLYSTNLIEQGQQFLATDTDGDEIADSFTFQLGQIINSRQDFQLQPNFTTDQMIITVVGRVKDASVNVNQRVLLINTSYVYDNTVQVTTLPGIVSVTVVEPSLNVYKTIVNYSYPFIEASNLVTYNLSVNHSQSSSSVAYNVQITDALPPQLTLVPGSIVTNYGEVITQQGAPNNTVIIRPGMLFNTTRPLLSIQYQAILTYLSPIGDDVTNTALVEWDSSSTCMSLSLSFAFALLYLHSIC